MSELKQELEPNQKGVAVYKSGEFIGYESINTPTSEELDAELEAEARELAIAEITAIKKKELKEKNK